MDVLTQRILVAALASAILAGCLGPPTTPRAPDTEHTVTTVIPSGLATANRTMQEFYLVLVQGAEHAKPLGSTTGGEGASCDLAWAYDLDRGAKSVRYDARRFPIDAKNLQVLVALEYHAPSLGHGIGEDCASKVLLSPFAGRATFQATVRADLRIELVIEPQNGFLTYNSSYFVPIGKKIHVNFTRLEEPAETKYKVTGDFEVVNLGAWNRTALEPVVPGRRG